jgi:predicted nucleic acid-binding protein
VALNFWLIDKSAYARLDRTPDSDLWASRIAGGLVQISSLTRLEIGFSFRNFSEASREVSSPPLLTMPIAYLTPTIEDRAVEVQMLLTQSGHHRAPSIPDLLIAATGEKLGMSVLHADKDFNLIVDVTGQPAEWLRIDGGGNQA